MDMDLPALPEQGEILSQQNSIIKAQNESTVPDEEIQENETITYSEPDQDIQTEPNKVVATVCREYNVDSAVNPNYNFDAHPSLSVVNNAEFKGDCFTKGCKWAPDGSCLLTNSDDNSLRIWNLPRIFLESKALEHDSPDDFKPVLHIKEGGLIYDYAWYPLMNSWDYVSCCLASVSRDSPTHLWDAYTGELRATYRAYNQVDEVEAPYSVTFDPLGQRIYCGFNNNFRIFDVNIPGRKCITKTLKTASGDSQRGIVSCIAVCPAIPSLFALGTYLKTIGLYTEGNKNALCVLQGHEGGLTHLQFSPDGLRLYSGGRRDGEILCWDLREPGKILMSLRRVVDTHQRIYFDLSSEGKYLLSGATDGTVSVWDTSVESSDSDIAANSVLSFQAHNDCTNGVSVHKQYPIIATCSGQRHCDQDIPSDEESESPSKDKLMQRDNSLKLWWAGSKPNTSEQNEKDIVDFKT